MHPRFTPILFGFLLSGMMSLMVSGISTLRTMGVVEGIVGLWMSAWIVSWLVAFPTALVAVPIVRRIVARIIQHPGEATENPAS